MVDMQRTNMFLQRELLLIATGQDACKCPCNSVNTIKTVQVFNSVGERQVTYDVDFTYDKI